MSEITNNLFLVLIFSLPIFIIFYFFIEWGSEEKARLLRLEKNQEIYLRKMQELKGYPLFKNYLYEEYYKTLCWYREYGISIKHMEDIGKYIYNEVFFMTEEQLSEIDNLFRTDKINARKHFFIMRCNVT